MSKFRSKEYILTIDKLVHGGQGIGTLEHGKKALVWNVLPGETVKLVTQKSKSRLVEGVATDIIKASPDRKIPRDGLYLSTSPWQMMSYAAENKYKLEILEETLARGGVEYSSEIDFYAPKEEWEYRNKMEYSFYGDDNGLHLALFNRGSHQKQIVDGSSIARPEIDDVARKICRILNSKNIRASDLKSIMLRCDQAGNCVAAIFTRNEKFPKIKELDGVAAGLVVYFSNPKSPASVVTEELYSYGSKQLNDELLGTRISYDVVSFFQVNIPAYEAVLKRIKLEVGDSPVVDMYAGTGSIGLSVAESDLKLVELDKHSVAMASINAENFEGNVEVIATKSEDATDYIKGEVVIFDPPRAGLHAKVTEATLNNLPKKIIYLSCNPSTLARDLELLQKKYKIKSIEGHNFFPRTPHIEALTVLELNESS